MLKESPIKANTREEFVYYMCEMHNNVNKRIDKPIFDCKEAFNFWGGDCGCSEKENNNTLTNKTAIDNSSSNLGDLDNK